MGKSYSHRANISPFPLLLFLIQFSTLQLICSSYDVPDKYFINCGSDQTVVETPRSFTGDEKPRSFTLTKQGSSVTSTNRALDNTSAVYNTARIFRQQSSYAFKTDDPGTSTYLVRLHFLAFTSSAADLSAAAFDVAASSGLLLLHNFTAKSITSTPLVKEFYVTISTNKFRVYFMPREPSFAFVNAIEFFPAPPVNFSLDSAIKVGGSDNKSVSSSVLQTVYRINVGGDKIEPVSDTIWRNWVTDDEFLKTKDNAKDKFYSNKPNYPSEDSKFGAPDLVYQTAKEMNVNHTSEHSDMFNITWTFNVNKSSSHIVRAHFCDIINLSPDDLVFNLYINGNFSREINLYKENIMRMAEAVYYDFAVSSRGSSVLDISIGPSNESDLKNAFLNGLEILEIKEGLASVPVEKESKSKSKLPIVIGSVLAGLVPLGILAGVLLVLSRRRKMKPTENSSWGQVTAYTGGSSHSRVTEATINGSPVPNLHLGLKISITEIQLATKNFNSKLLIGKGGFGNVYKGTLLNGTKVAVKRSLPGSGQGLPEFQTEITVLSQIRHRHLVSLIGYCNERAEMILVYEFMEKGTLRDHLYSSNLPRLSWKQRLQICIGSASGLQYLHKGSSRGIIHRDVKSTNILLDENYVAKVADFGLSRSSPLEDTHVSTTVKGTFGYLDPEYFRTQQLTEKSDVYSFGVVLLEVLCARAAIDPSLPREQMNLAEWAMKCKNKGLVEEIVDPAIKGQVNPNSLRKFADAAEKCLQEDGSDRPAMSDVIWDLEYALQLQQTAAPREPHEDSTATASGFSAAVVLPIMGRLPSLSTSFGGGDESYVTSRDLSNVTAGSDVFSQLKGNGAR